MGFKILKNNDGFTLLEVLIAGSVMTVILLALSSQILSSSKSAVSIEKILVFNDLILDIQHVTNDSKMCTTSLIGTVPTVNQSLALTYGGIKINDITNDAGAFFQNQISITSLKWADITTVSPTQKIGYISVQANLQGKNTSSTALGGNLRTYPKPGSLPAGVMVMMNTDSVTGKVINCGGGSSDKPYADQTWQFISPCEWAGGNMGACTGQTATLPLAMPSANYTVMCETNTTNLSGVAPSGIVTVINQTAATFGYIVTTVMSMGNHNEYHNHVQMVCHAVSKE